MALREYPVGSAWVEIQDGKRVINVITFVGTVTNLINMQQFVVDGRKKSLGPTRARCRPELLDTFTEATEEDWTVVGRLIPELKKSRFVSIDMTPFIRAMSVKV